MGQDIDFIKIAIEEAEKAFQEGEVPVGAVIVVDNEIIARGHNKVESMNDPTAHAEILVIRSACQKIENWRLNKAILYVTKEPCIMCAGAMINARLSRLVYGCDDLKGGATKSLYQLLSDNRLNHQVEVVSGILGDECAQLLKRFFRVLREQ